MNDWNCKEGKLIVDGNHYTYWNSKELIYVRDGGSYTRSTTGPHFLDLGVMGHCRNCCYDCYMQSKRTAHNMAWDTVDAIVHEHRDSLCQVSFGGAGDPLDHEAFSRLSYAGNGQSRERWEEAHPKWDIADSASWRAWNESLYTTARCVTINPRGRAFTPSQVATLGQFEAVGLSCGSATGSDSDCRDDIVRLLRQAEMLDYNRRPTFVLHLIIGDMHNDLRKFVHLLTYNSVRGVLLLARKQYGKQRDDIGAFYSREQQISFWKSVVATYDVVPKAIAVDSCLAPLVDRKLFPNFDPAAMHPCDAGRFSWYIHADGKSWLCSCGADPVKSWEAALRTRQSCKNVLSAANRDKAVLRTEWPNPPVVIQHGPMTNSSSSSYFVIAPRTAKLKLEVLDFAGREKLSEEDEDCNFSWYEHNKRLVKVSLGEWASWCAAEIAGAEDSRQAVALKTKLDGFTKRILAGNIVYYLVANRDDNEVPPTRYAADDVSDHKKVILVPAGAEH